ncbi:TPA: hypothetical protein ACHSNL_001876 [Klebsiella variicola]
MSLKSPMHPGEFVKELYMAHLAYLQKEWQMHCPFLHQRLAGSLMGKAI